MRQTTLQQGDRAKSMSVIRDLFVEICQLFSFICSSRKKKKQAKGQAT